MERDFKRFNQKLCDSVNVYEVHGFFLQDRTQEAHSSARPPCGVLLLHPVGHRYVLTGTQVEWLHGREIRVSDFACQYVRVLCCSEEKNIRQFIGEINRNC